MEMRMTSTSPIRTGQAQQRVSRRDQRAPRGPDGKRLPRRVFTTDYKLAMLAEYDRCTVPGGNLSRPARRLRRWRLANMLL
jgi:hypothetical protein